MPLFTAPCTAAAPQTWNGNGPGRLSDVADLSCQELVELVTDYFGGALTPSDRARFDAHVADCPGCGRYLAQMRATIALAGESRSIEDRPDVTELLAAFRAWQR